LGLAVTIHVGNFVFGRGRRSPKVLLVLDERNALLRTAADRFCIGMSNRQAAAHLRTALLRYREGAWRRERADLTMPQRHANKLTGLLWRS
jgi:hypothetical protein